jgi:predicted TPR repeat methyltransferase
LWRNQPAGALAAAEAVLATSPTDPDALVTRARALEASGRAGEAADAWRQAWRADPAAEGGPVGSSRIASTWHFDEPPASVEPAPSAAPGAPRMGPGL